jgi:hypothetical protein
MILKRVQQAIYIYLKIYLLKSIRIKFCIDSTGFSKNKYTLMFKF